MHLTLLTPAAELTSQPIASAIVPGLSGDFGVLPGHMPFISTLRANATLVVEGLDGTTTRFQLAGGVAEVTPTTLTILAEAATQQA